MNLHVYIWVLLAVVVLALALYRLLVGVDEDDTLHVVENEGHLVAQQKQLFKKVDLIERWGQLLTVVVVVYGLALAGIYLYHKWLEGFQIPRQ